MARIAHDAPSRGAVRARRSPPHSRASGQARATVGPRPSSGRVHEAESQALCPRRARRREGGDPGRLSGGACYHRPAMSDRPRFYLTTAIAYANNAPGLHTVYEVIGADVIARWHRMLGDDTRFLTGTDEHSVNIAQAAAAQGRTPREFVDEKVELFRAAEDALLISPDRFIRTTDPDHYRSAQEMVRRAHANGDIYLDTYEGWYCPNEGFKNASDLLETAKGMQCPNHPTCRAPVAERAQLVLPPVGLPGPAARVVRGAPRLRPARLPAQRDAGLHPPGPPGLLDQPRRRDLGHPVPDRRERRDRRSARTGRGTPRRARSTSGTTR